MISQATINDSTIHFLQALKKSEFQGDIEDSYGARIVASTDNSVYQVIPQAIIYPRIADDINCLVALLAEHITSNSILSSNLSIVARGGGTGTNGQSLNESLILDTSRYLNKIISLDEEAMLVTVEPGVVLDQLNQFLESHGLFFPPDVSSSSRATIGGMVATDASGKGSRVYGKTSDYIQTLDIVLSDGTDFCIQTCPKHEIPHKTPHKAKKYKNWGGCITKNKDFTDNIQDKVLEIVTQNKNKIRAVFPQMNRGLTGYNLEKVMDDSGNFNLAYLLAGSEGTLALTKKIMLRVIKKPKLRALIAVLYDDFDNTLEHISQLLKAEPTAIEVLDDNILKIAQEDSIWQDVQSSFQDIPLNANIKGLNFIEVTADSKQAIDHKCQQLSKIITASADQYGVITHRVETQSKVITGLWNIRKRAVGLLAALEGERRAIAFVEDCAVPPEHLPAFIKAFRQILDSHGLGYGMYGHADVGCLHVRPTLNMKQQSDQQLLREITDDVANLAKKYGGLLWGEHGRGYRGEYSPLFFGEELYPLLREIKAVFDPQNIFNPGKLATPTHSSSKVIAIDKVPFRGQFDAEVADSKAHNYQSAMLCNGNAACFSWDVSEAMCPSYKATGDKRQSPKGRASMLREWLRLSSDNATGSNKLPLLESLEHELYASLNSCLSCKSCTHSCPIKVDIPELKSKFLAHYHKKNKRKVSDYLFASFETMAKMGRVSPVLANSLFQNSFTQKTLEKVFGITHLPKFSSSLISSLRKLNADFIDINRVPSYQEKTVILLPDTFNASYDSQVIIASYQLLTTLGYQVLIAPIFDNGKALHVKGYRNQFKKIAKQHIAHLEKLSATGLPLLSVEVVTRFMHSKEYAEITDNTVTYSVQSIESWLNNTMNESQIKQIQSCLINNALKISYKLFPHCMEQTADKLSATHWHSLFSIFSIPVEIVNAGCCGMSGLFGHEKENQQLSQDIFDRGWHNKLAPEEIILATGFSCRCQLNNHNHAVKHPIEILANALQTD